VELHFYPTIFIRINLFARGSSNKGGLTTLHQRFWSITKRSKLCSRWNALEEIGVYWAASSSPVSKVPPSCALWVSEGNYVAAVQIASSQFGDFELEPAGHRATGARSGRYVMRSFLFFNSNASVGVTFVFLVVLSRIVVNFETLIAALIYLSIIVESRLVVGVSKL